MTLPPHLRQLLESKHGKLKLGAGVAACVLLLALVLGSSGAPAPVTYALPEEEVVEKPAPPAPPNSTNSEIILDLFSPSDASLARQHTESTYSQQIEETMAVTFVLARCLAISQDDYSAIFRALILYAERVKLAPDAQTAEARVREIAESSSASYSLIYSRMSCEDPNIAPLAREIVLWADGIFKLD